MSFSSSQATHPRDVELRLDQFRLLELLPGTPDEDLCFRLIYTDFDRHPPYEALSYCWGDGDAVIGCKCEDASSTYINLLTKNLAIAMRILRTATESRVLWIDQICIDQGNIPERNSQVKLMCRIYSSAEKVLVWLGPPDDNTFRAFDLLDRVEHQFKQQVLKSRRNFKNVFRTAAKWLELPSGDDPACVALRDLLSKREWFSRLWTFQEIVSSKDAIIICGEHTLPWDIFANSIRLLGIWDRTAPSGLSHLRKKGRFIDAVNDCRHSKHGDVLQDNIRKAEQRDLRPLDLLNLIRTTKTRSCSVPHDKIYGLLAVACNTNLHSIDVNYDEPPQDLFIRITKHIIDQHCDLSVLDLVRIAPFRKTLVLGPEYKPSWVPDFKSDREGIDSRLDSYQSIQHGSLRRYSATGQSKITVEVNSNYTLPIQAVYVGKVSLLCSPDGNWEKDSAIGDNVAAGGLWAQMAQSLAVDGKYLKTNESITLAYSRLRVWDFLREERALRRRPREDLTVENLEPGPTPIIIPPRGRPYIEGENASILSSWIVACTSRKRFFITDNSYMGLCQMSCLEGDQVWLVMGHHEPCILRELATGRYQFKGPAYVHGIMYGEYLVQKFKDQDSRGRGLTDDTWLDRLADEIPFECEELLLV